jgi:hypothetical protein
VLSRNDRRFGAEIDFLCGRGACDEVFTFDVKRVHRTGSVAYPQISAAQLRRLRRAARQMQVVAGKFITVRISLLLVNAKTGDVEIVADI